MLRSFMLTVLTTSLTVLLISCGGSASEVNSDPSSGDDSEQKTRPDTTASWPAALPQDAAQPWETISNDGYVLPAGDRSASALNLDSEFVAGVERYSEGGSVADNGEAASLASTAGQFSYAIYRVPLGGAEPGVVTVDANLTAGSGYYVGLADYARGSWQWFGPYYDNHVRFSTASGASADFTSDLGSVFACAVVHDGAACDVIGIGVNPIDTADTEAPPAPDAPAVTAVNGGLGLEWMPVVAGDLAGYRVYFSRQSFLDQQGAGIKVEDNLEGLTRHVLGGLDAVTYVRISAVDISGNESPLSDIVSAEPLDEAAQHIQVTASAPSGALGDVIGLTATGAESYDFDIDGDGTYDITGDTTGMTSVDTSSLGIIRAGVRGTSGSGTSVALGGVSVIIAGNSRPVASASASVTFGEAPLDVTFSGSDSTDFDGSVVGGGWDFDGDGTYDVWDDADITYVTSADHTYDAPGVYNAKLRVVDDDGAWDVDTVALLVAPSPAGGNQPPVAVLNVSPQTGWGPTFVSFSGAESYDPDGTIVNYEWDLNGDGEFNTTVEEYSRLGEPSPVPLIYYPGDPFVITLRVTDNEAATSTATATLAIHGWLFVTVDSDGTTGEFPCLVVVDGTPAISYWDATAGDLNYARAYGQNGRFWGTPVTVDGGEPGTFNSMAVVNGQPAITYGLSNIKYARAGDAQGATWNSPVTIEGASLRGTSLAVVNGNPAVFYSKVENFITHDTVYYEYARATNATGSAWSGPTELRSYDTTNPLTNQSLSLIIADGNPAIAYGSENPDDAVLAYRRAQDADGTSWGSWQQGGLGAKNCISMVPHNGIPAIMYNDGDLQYMVAVDAAGSSWNESVEVLVDGTPFWLSLAYVDDKPVCLYIEQNLGELRLARALDSAGTIWGPEEVVDSYVDDFQCSVAEVAGHIGIAYFDNGPMDLIYGVLF